MKKVFLSIVLLLSLAFATTTYNLVSKTPAGFNHPSSYLCTYVDQKGATITIMIMSGCPLQYRQ